MRLAVWAILLLLTLPLQVGAADVQTGPRSPADWHALAEDGDPAAALALGNLYATGEGVPRDDERAAYWYGRAAARGLPEAQFALGLLYATGQGVPRDLRLAHMWVNLAAVTSVPGSWEARDRLADLMTREEIDGAVRMALDWQPMPPE